MFNGFPVNNTPAVQVWDFVRGASTTAARNIFLSDDCAPLQFFKTGVASDINLYLPPSYPEGKTLTIVNSPYLNTALSIAVYASDARNTSSGASGTGDNIYRVRPGTTLQFFYTRTTLDLATGAAAVTGWNCISQGSANSATPNGFATAGGVALATNAFAAGANATASGSQSVALGGQTNTASNTASAVLGGVTNTASGLYSTVIGGQNNTASGSYSSAVGGSNATSNAFNSIVLGGTYGSVKGISNYVVSSSSSASYITPGASQAGCLILAKTTSDATPTVIATNNSAPASSNQFTLANYSTAYVRGSCVAAVNGAFTTKVWTFDAVIRRGASAATTTIIGSVAKNIIAADAGAATWDITIDANTTLGGLRVTVTGQAATQILWICRLDVTEGLT